MAAPMQKVMSNMLRPLFGNIYKFRLLRQCIPVVNFCQQTEEHNQRHKLDVSSLFSRNSESDAVTERRIGLSQGETETDEEAKSFATMFRHSKFVQLGDLKDKILAGRIFYVLNNDLYIDFGGKFFYVCPRPIVDSQQYVKGKRVRVMVHKFEMSSSFMRSAKHVTLLEADATLLGLFDQMSHLEGSTSDTKESPDSRLKSGVDIDTDTDINISDTDHMVDDFTQSILDELSNESLGKEDESKSDTTKLDQP